MITACSSCHGPLPDQGTYSVSISLRPDAPKRWRTTSITCSLPCLAAVVAEMQASVQRRREQREPSLRALMAEPPAGRRT